MSDITLIDAVKARNHAEAEQLIRNGADANQQDEQGWTPLNFAAGSGDLPLVRLLVESEADVFKVGRDRRTPCQIALAAGQLSVVKYLREAEDRYSGEKPPRRQRKYCRAYRLGDLRKYPEWSESRNSGESDATREDKTTVFIHQDLSVTASASHNENVIYNRVDSGWEAFCRDALKFNIPDDLDLISSNKG